MGGLKNCGLAWMPPEWFLRPRRGLRKEKQKIEEMRRREAQGIEERLGTLRLQRGPASEAPRHAGAGARATCFGLPYAARYAGFGRGRVLFARPAERDRRQSVGWPGAFRPGVCCSERLWDVANANGPPRSSDFLRNRRDLGTACDFSRRSVGPAVS